MAWRFAAVAVSVLLPNQVVNAQITDTDWQYSDGRDALTDLQTARAAVRSSDGRAALIIKCDGASEHVVSVQLVQDKFLGRGERALTFRFDSVPPVDLAADYTGKVAYISYDKTVISLAALLKGDRTVLVRAWDYNQQPVDAQFEIKGGATYIDRILSVCGYSLNAEGKPDKNKK